MRIFDGNQSYQFGGGPFSGRLNQPGRLLDKDYDFAFGPLARFDHAQLKKGGLVKMHEHRDDEILSYIWQGELKHEDSTGKTVQVTSHNLMMMNAGESFFHEESVPEKNVEMLQIFIRPRESQLEPHVHFYQRDQIPTNQWNEIGGPEGENAPLTIRQNIFLYELYLDQNKSIEVPKRNGYTPLLYVASGNIEIEGEELSKGFMVTDLEQPLSQINANENSIVLLFQVDMNAEATLEGMFSGIQN